MQIHNIEIFTAQDWQAFVAENVDAILQQCGTIEAARQLALNGGLEIGGGAAPLFIVTIESPDA